MALSPKTRSYVRATVDYAGLVAFLVGYIVTRDILKATWCLVAVSAVALALGFAVERRIAPLPLISGGAALFFGILTLVFKDPRIIKIKSTIVYFAFAMALLGGLAMKKNFVKLLISDALVMSDRAWRSFTLRYGVFFLVMAVANEAIWRTQSDKIWVGFHFPGALILTVLFSLSQTPLLMRGMKEAEAAGEDVSADLNPDGSVKTPPPLIVD